MWSPASQMWSQVCSLFVAFYWISRFSWEIPITKIKGRTFFHAIPTEQFYCASSLETWTYKVAATSTLITLPGSSGAMFRINANCLCSLLNMYTAILFVSKFVTLKIKAFFCFDEYDQNSSDVCKFQTSSPRQNCFRLIFFYQCE